MYCHLCVSAGYPAELPYLLHDLVAELPVELRYAVRVDKLSQTERIHRRLRSRCASKHPQPRVWCEQSLQRLPTISLYVLIRRGFVSYDQIKPTVSYLVFDNLKPVEVDDDELSTTLHNLNALIPLAVRNITTAVHGELEQVLLPC